MLATAQPSLCDPQVPHRRSVGTRAANLLPGGQGSKVLDPQVESHGWSALSGSGRRYGNRQGETSVPAARHPADGHGANQRGRRERTMPLHPGVADALEAEATIIKAPACSPGQAVITAR